MRVKNSLIFDEISNNSLIYIKKSQKNNTFFAGLFGDS